METVKTDKVENITCLAVADSNNVFLILSGLLSMKMDDKKKYNEKWDTQNEVQKDVVEGKVLMIRSLMTSPSTPFIYIFNFLWITVQNK